MPKSVKRSKDKNIVEFLEFRIPSVVSRDQSCIQLVSFTIYYELKIVKNISTL
jgi:hypothetical protein